MFLDASKAFDKVWHQGLLLEANIPSTLVTPNTKLALYADDTIVLASSVRPRLVVNYLQTAIEEVEN